MLANRQRDIWTCSSLYFAPIPVCILVRRGGGTSSRTWTERATASKESLRAIFYEEKLFLAVNDWQTAAVFEAADDDRCSIKESVNM